MLDADLSVRGQVRGRRFIPNWRVVPCQEQASQGFPILFRVIFLLRFRALSPPRMVDTCLSWMLIQRGQDGVNLNGKLRK